MFKHNTAVANPKNDDLLNAFVIGSPEKGFVDSTPATCWFKGIICIWRKTLATGFSAHSLLRTAIGSALVA